MAAKEQAVKPQAESLTTRVARLENGLVSLATAVKELTGRTDKKIEAIVQETGKMIAVLQHESEELKKQVGI